MLMFQFYNHIIIYEMRKADCRNDYPDLSFVCYACGFLSARDQGFLLWCAFNLLCLVEGCVGQFPSVSVSVVKYRCGQVNLSP